VISRNPLGDVAGLRHILRSRPSASPEGGFFDVSCSGCPDVGRRPGSYETIALSVSLSLKPRLVCCLGYQDLVRRPGSYENCVQPVVNIQDVFVWLDAVPAFSVCPEIYNGLSSAFRRKVEASFSERCGGTEHSVSSMACDYLHIGYRQLKPTVSVRLKAELRRTPVGITLGTAIPCIQSILKYEL